MSFKSELKIGGRVFNLLKVDYDFRQKVNYDGFPGAYPQSGFINFIAESQTDTFFLDWILSANQQKSGSLLFYKRDNMSKMKELVFTDAYCVGFREKFSSKGEHPFFMEVKLSAGQMRFGTSSYKNPWYESDGRESEDSGKVYAHDFFQPGIKAEPTEIIAPVALENPVSEELIPISGSPRLNKTINAIGVGLVSLVPTFLATRLSNKTGNQSLVDPSWDGKILSCTECNKEGVCGIEDPNSKCNTDGLPVKGKSPQVKGKGPCLKNPQKKVYYINGIDTPPVNNCKTSKKLASTLCSEVVSMYNRTEGIKGDLFECVRSIRKSDKVPPADAMEEMIENHFGNPPKEPYAPLELYAHSQGGLITQQALIRYKNFMNEKFGEEETDRILKNISVKSFGTAEKGWPNGPDYEQFTNEFDPVPKVIAAAQKKYKKETFTEDTLSCKIGKNHTFALPFGNPIHSHSMDNVYIEKLKETRVGTQEDKCSVCPH